MTPLATMTAPCRLWAMIKIARSDRSEDTRNRFTQRWIAHSLCSTTASARCRFRLSNRTPPELPVLRYRRVSIRVGARTPRQRPSLW
jgi:hypothetical protein